MQIVNSSPHIYRVVDGASKQEHSNLNLFQYDRTRRHIIKLVRSSLRQDIV